MTTRPRKDDVRPFSAQRSPMDEAVLAQPGTVPVSGNVAFSRHEGLIRGRFRARLSWDTTQSPEDMRLHLGAFLLDETSRVPVGNPFYSVHHDNDRSKDGSTLRHGLEIHGGHRRDEMITVSLGRVSTRVERVVLIAYIQDPTRRHTFLSLRGGVVTIYEMPPFSGPEDEEGDDPEKDYTTAREIGKHTLNQDYDQTDTVVTVGELLRGGPHEWFYRDIAMGHRDLVEVGASYGVIFR